ncbi:hypothetical protein J7K43_06595, partial [Candidatus Calescamantes bacterium]|nr:hypothetical protein [Candidatus Calescamantes bacterium]
MSYQIAKVLVKYGIYSYFIPLPLREKLEVGMRVKVEVRKRIMWGVVVGKNEKKEKGLKPILEIIDKSPLFPPSYLSFAREVAHYYATDWFEI